VRKKIGIIVAFVFFLLAIATTGELYTLPKNIFPYSPPGYYEVYEQEWDGRSNPVVPTGEYEFHEGGYGDVLFKNIISSVLLCYIAYRTGRLLLLIDLCSNGDYVPTFFAFWYFGAGCLILYNFGWISRATTWHYAGVLSVILFIFSAITFIISLFVAPYNLVSSLDSKAYKYIQESNGDG
jgi:hypothetical protein